MRSFTTLTWAAAVCALCAITFETANAAPLAVHDIVGRDHPVARETLHLQQPSQSVLVKRSRRSGGDGLNFDASIDSHESRSAGVREEARVPVSSWRSARTEDGSQRRADTQPQQRLGRRSWSSDADAAEVQEGKGKGKQRPTVASILATVTNSRNQPTTANYRETADVIVEPETQHKVDVLHEAEMAAREAEKEEAMMIAGPELEVKGA